MCPPSHKTEPAQAVSIECLARDGKHRWQYHLNPYLPAYLPGKVIHRDGKWMAVDETYAIGWYEVHASGIDRWAYISKTPIAR